MLKRVFLAVLFACSLFLTNVFSYDDANLSKTITIENNTAADATTYVATTTFVPGRTRVLSFTACALPLAASASYVALYDATSSTAFSLDDLLGESETVSTGSSHDKIFPYPKVVSNQLKVIVGPYTVAIIEYTK